MKKLLFTCITITALGFSAQAQNNELKALADQFASNLKEVKTGKSTITQEAGYPEPAVIKYKSVEVDSKGKSSTKSFTFNMADVDPYTVKSETSRDVIYVTFSITNKQKLIATTKDGEKDNYESDLRFLATDVDNARELVEILKKTVPPARDLMKSRLALNSYQAQADWLKLNIKDVKSGDKAYNQSFTLGEFPGSVIFNQTEVDNKGSKIHKYEFNLADIDPATVNFDISGNKLSIKFETVRDKKVILHQEDGQAKPFLKDLNILTSSVEIARDLRAVLLLAIPEAKGLVEKDLVTYKSSQQALTDIKKYLSQIKYGDETIDQTLEGDCKAGLTVTETDPKSTKKHLYKFNFMDLNKEALTSDVSGNKMFIELVTRDKIKLLQEYEGSELKGYDYKSRIYVKDAEASRRLLSALKSAAEFCANEYKDPFSTSANNALDWLKANVKNIEKQGIRYEQKLEPVENDKLKYTKVKADDKKTVEEIFEFNLSDLNPESVEFNVSGEDLEVKVESNYQEKIIKYYKDGEIQNYKNEIHFTFEDIEDARGVKNALKQVIKSSQK